MAPATRLCTAVLPLRQVSATVTKSALACRVARALHHQPPQPAKVVPVYGTGPPPEPPTPNPEFTDASARIARRRRQAELLKQAKEVRAAASARNAASKAGSASPQSKSTGLKKRFWKEVSVQEIDGALQVHLDARPLRHPTTKKIIRLPLSKRALATALAIEWDQLVSAQEATRQHLIPLTSLVCRAIDIGEDDAAHQGDGEAPIRASIASVLIRYLDTDSLLCWAPAVDVNDPASPSSTFNDEGKSLRDVQEEVAMPVVSYLTTRVWPGVTIQPVLDENSIMPRQQEPGTREVVMGWILGLSEWELAGLERATLGGKSLLAAARLVVEWSEGGAGVVNAEAAEEGGKRFGVEEAAKAVSVEVEWQTGRWGEVEDTHDVEKEDVRRQFGSVVLLVSGQGKA
ncbi:putative mitochondrial protein atp12 precursor [Podospora aff. communis PSN243]|uniref:Mitochondrial protein atp12 n=1 Tax=Podospora aff. communis PSN243 TaxID=3040156 RepID=A0AAV9GWW1_9PEZI|nr:putative mitochondrial protein atp12 precursor [Podospora aff. communis PSN243]